MPSTNVLTEILQARGPARFRADDQTSVAEMNLADITGLPRVLNKTTVAGARYARFTADAEGLQERLG